MCWKIWIITLRSRNVLENMALTNINCPKAIRRKVGTRAPFLEPSWKIRRTNWPYASNKGMGTRWAPSLACNVLAPGILGKQLVFMYLAYFKHPIGDLCYACIWHWCAIKHAESTPWSFFYDFLISPLNGTLPLIQVDLVERRSLHN